MKNRERDDQRDFDVDLVYLWVDGNDPAWQKKRESLGLRVKYKDSKNCKGRYQDNSELKYSLRSVQKFAPWIRRIYIVTDNQIPKWLDTTNEKIKIVDHQEILPKEALPTFNSRIIEHFLYKIPGIEEHFLYANDDMFFSRPTHPGDFFEKDGRPIVRFNRRPFRNLSFWLKEKLLGKKISNYNQAIRNTAKLVKSKYGKFIGHKTHHNIDAYRRSDYQHTHEVFENEIDKTLNNRVRGENDVQRNVYSYVPVLEGNARVRFVNQKESFRCHIDNEGNFKKLNKMQPLLFCLNDSEYADDEDRKRVKDFLEKRFPEKSNFEL